MSVNFRPMTDLTEIRRSDLGHDTILLQNDRKTRTRPARGITAGLAGIAIEHRKKDRQVLEFLRSVKRLFHLFCAFSVQVDPKMNGSQPLYPIVLASLHNGF
jgi:hypothetical protein